VNKVALGPLKDHGCCFDNPMVSQQLNSPLHQQANSSVFRLDQPELLDVQAIEAATPAPQRGAWRHLQAIFDRAQTLQCSQFSVEPDATHWRLRFRTTEGLAEDLIPDPGNLIWAMETLQVTLWGDDYHDQSNRQTRFTWLHEGGASVMAMRVVHTVNGDLMQFDCEKLKPMPPLLDELLLQSEQLAELRQRLQQQHGMVLITSCDELAIDDTLIAINQELISPLLSASHHAN